MAGKKKDVSDRMTATEAALEEFKALEAKNQAPCPHCGYCPACGRGGFRTVPYYPTYPYPTWPYDPYRITWTSGTAIQGNTITNSTGGLSFEAVQ